MKSLNTMVAEFGRGKDKAPRKKRANLRNHVLGGTIVGGIAGNALTKPITVPIELVGGLAGSAIGAGAGAATYGARRAWRGGKALVAKLRGKEPEKYDYMKSLSRMTAEFARTRGATDKKPRKRGTLAGYIGKGAAIGALGMVGGSALLGGVHGAAVAKQAAKGLGIPFKPIRTRLQVGAGGAMLEGMKGAMVAPGAAIAGGGIGAGAYGINKLRNRNKEEKPTSRLQSARKKLGGMIGGN
jgi:hypothetical protein